MEIILANTEQEYEAAKQLFLAYQKYLGVDLCFQSFDKELNELAQMYSTPKGALLLALEDGVYGGCVAVRYKKEGVCEMKRLYVMDNFKGKGLGRKLAVQIMAKAKELGYQTMVLDTLNKLTAALQLYASLDFLEIPPYYENPLEGVIYMEKKL